MTTVAEKRARFRQLHVSGCFVIPNPWDVGSARYLEHLGFQAIATTSAGFAFSRGLPDYAVPLDLMLDHFSKIAGATKLPVNADFENAYADNAEGVAENVRRCVQTGVAGLSVEDSTRQTDAPLYERDHAVARIAAAKSAIGDALLVARTECFLVGRDDINEVISRLVAFSAAGADCLYAPGVRTRDHIKAIVDAVAPKPVNVLISAPGRLTVADAAELGVRRVSVGGALARAAWGGLMRAAQTLAQQGTFDGFADAAPHAELNEFFRKDVEGRGAS